jgi:2-polyprenyl-6-methoxyphenol hydroxylase-like FAD-dependent oxidoreductase
MSNRHGHAVVIGSSIAGLLAARVLADHFAAVTVLERDQLPSDGPAHRRGVPQAQHLHQMLMRGQLVFEQLFPGLRQDLLAAGAPEMDSAQDFLWRNPTGWGVRYRSGVIRLAFTRDLLDWHVRLHLSKLSSVRSQAGAEVVGLLPTGGVSLADSSRLDADLVVDASGRGSRAAAWLRQLGYPPPAEQIVDAHLGYASRLYHHPTDCHNDWQAVFIQAAPPARNRAGVITSVEGERWMVSLAGGARDWPPTDAAGFLAFARSLPSPIVYDAIRQAQPASAITGTRSGENRLRRFDTLPRSPERFVALGDAVCAFNPVYGQGMSVAALEALALDSCLRQYGASLARPFQKQVARIVALRGRWPPVRTHATPALKALPSTQRPGCCMATWTMSSPSPPNELMYGRRCSRCSTCCGRRWGCSVRPLLAASWCASCVGVPPGRRSVPHQAGVSR